MQLEIPAFGQQKSPMHRAFRGTYLFYVPIMVTVDNNDTVLYGCIMVALELQP